MSADLENLNKCLRLITEIRSNSYKVFNVASDGVSNDSNDRKFLSDLKSMLGKVGGLVGELEQSLSNQQPISNPLPLGHSVYMNLDAAIDNIAVYNDLVTSYKWMDKVWWKLNCSQDMETKPNFSWQVHDYSNGAASFFSQNSLNWSYGKIAKSRGKRLTSTIQKGHPQYVEDKTITIDNLIWRNFHQGLGKPCQQCKSNVRRHEAPNLKTQQDPTQCLGRGECTSFSSPPCITKFIRK